MEQTEHSKLSKSERKKLKKEEKQQKKEQARLEQGKREKSKKVRNYLILFLIVLGIIGFFYWKSIPPKDAPELVVAPEFHDFGDVSQAKGTVSTLMKISNEGKSDLVLNGLDTSCGCTSAAIVANGKESPRFSMAMHGTNPTNWKQVIKPGDAVQLKVYYDPSVHKTMRGSVTRSVIISSNDPMKTTKEVKIRANQVD